MCLGRLLGICHFVGVNMRIGMGMGGGVRGDTRLFYGSRKLFGADSTSCPDII